MPTFTTILSICALLCVGCGIQIGDSCEIDTDCSPDGDRICDRNSPGGYCTVLGCDYDSCPDDSVCVRFFSSQFTNVNCATNDDCTPDELCTLGGTCAPRLAETRYCMQPCSGDCRDGYKCYTREDMIAQGSEPVPNAGMPLDDNPTRYCAPDPGQN